MKLPNSNLRGFIPSVPRGARRANTTSRPAHRAEIPGHTSAKSKGRGNGRPIDQEPTPLTPFLCPPRDPRKQDQLFYAIRRRLIEELRPTTFTAQYLLDIVVNDMVQLVRVREMVEELQRPVALPADEQAKFDDIQRVRRDLGILNRIVARLDTGEGALLNADEAKAVAPLFYETVEYVKYNLDDLLTDEELAESTAKTSKNLDPEKEKGPPPRQTETLAQEEIREYQAFLKGLGDFANRIKKPDIILRMLTGPQAKLGNDRQRMRSLIDRIAGGLRGQLFRVEGIEKKFAAALAAKRSALAVAPEQLIALQRWGSQIEASIEKNLRKLSE